MAKVAAGITDTPATMAIKSHLRNGNPLVIAISTNDGLAGSAENIGKLLNRNNFSLYHIGKIIPLQNHAL